MAKTPAANAHPLEMIGMSENSDSGFKVVDRRSFSADGTRREDAASESKQGKAPPKAEPGKASARSNSPVSEAESPEYLEQEPSGFETLVDYLSTTAMFQMGLLPGPGGERIGPDLPNARRTIDLLEVLQQKTQGNLTPGESQLLDEALYQLRMGFLELQQRGAPKRK